MDPTELAVHRENTRAFIAAQPIVVELVPVVEVRQPSGGVMPVDQPPRPPQTFRLIPQHHDERPVGSNSSAQSRDAGVVRRYDYTLLGEWDAVVVENDWWNGPNGQRLVVDSKISYNEYEVKAMVTSTGRRPSHGG